MLATTDSPNPTNLNAKQQHNMSEIALVYLLGEGLLISASMTINSIVAMGN